MIFRIRIQITQLGWVEPGSESRFKCTLILTELCSHPSGKPLSGIFLWNLWDAALSESGASRQCLETHIPKPSPQPWELLRVHPQVRELRGNCSAWAPIVHGGIWLDSSSYIRCLLLGSFSHPLLLFFWRHPPNKTACTQVFDSVSASWETKLWYHDGNS